MKNFIYKGKNYRAKSKTALRRKLKINVYSEKGKDGIEEIKII